MNVPLYLKEVETFSVENKVWNIPGEEAKYLYDLIIKYKYESVLEFGTSCGYSALWFEYAVSKNNGYVDTIESNKNRSEIAKKHFKKSGLNRINLILDHFPECVKNIKKKYDFIFIDIIKLYYIDCFKVSAPFLNKNGMIVADNISTHKSETREFVDYISNLPGFVTKILDIGNGISISKKIN